MSTTTRPLDTGAGSARTSTWQEQNRAVVELHLTRLRLLVRHRCAWLRQLWRDLPAGDPRRVLITDAEVDLLLSRHSREERGFSDQDTEARQVAEETARVERTIDELAATMARPPALAVLVERFELTAFERDVVVLCLAPEIDPMFARLYAYVQDAPHLLYPTASLAEDLFGDPGDAWLPSSPLLGYKLVERDVSANPHSPRSLFPLRVDPTVEAYLLGRHRTDERVRRQLRPLEPVPLPDSLQGVVEAALAQLEAQPTGRVLVDLVGPADVGRTVAAALLRSIGLQPHEWNITGLSPDPAEIEGSLRVVEREAALLGLGLYVDGLQDAPALEQVLDQSRVLTVVSSAQGARTGRVPCHVPVPALSAGDRAWLWSHFLGPGSGLAGEEVHALAQQFELGPQAIGSIVARSRATAAGGHDGGPDLEALWQACRERGGSRLDGLGARLRTERSWEELVLPSDAEAQLREIVSQVSHRTRVYDEWGFGERLPRGRGITALFAGPSGTGKTLAAEVLATALRLDLCRVDLSGVVNKYIGETEKNLRQVFDAAEEAGWILFFDEADALFGKRTEVKDSHDRYANIEVNYLLQRMEQYRGLAILATNRRSALDRAFLRRIRFVVDFPLPDVDSRRRIWLRGFPSPTPLGELDFDGLAQLEMTGANITTVTTNAAFLAAAEGSPVEMHHVGVAIRREYAKLEQFLPAEARP